MQTNKILSAKLIDLIFDGRNKDYGAYELRNTYSRRVKKAMLVTFSVAAVAIGGATMANSFKKDERNRSVTPGIELKEITEKKPEKLPEPIKKVEPVQVKTITYTVPKIVDKEILDNPPPTIDDLDSAKIELFTQEGVVDDKTVGPQNPGASTGVVEDKVEKEPAGPFTSVEIDAKFNGNWKAFLERNLNANIPVDNNAPPGRYSVIIQFVVDVEGNVSDIKPLTEHGYGMEAEAIRAIKKATKWEPAFQNGVHVKAYKKQVIVFDISDSE